MEMVSRDNQDVYLLLNKQRPPEDNFCDTERLKSQSQLLWLTRGIWQQSGQDT